MNEIQVITTAIVNFNKNQLIALKNLVDKSKENANKYDEV
jgi:hypothetical protein